jgi:ArsR family transcriptional regulator, nickel/cobalt-responsive transcriptional repressor
MKTCSSNRAYAGAMGHGAAVGGGRPSFDLATATSVATTLQALATPSRLLILATLQDGPRTVGDLSQTVGMEQSAVSHQLRLLRNLGLVQGERHGRHIIYSLYDNHVSELLEQAIHHAEHVRLGAADRSPRAVNE